MPSTLEGLDRCAGCGLPPELCACAELPKLELPFDLVLVRHVVERARGSNTGRLLKALAPQSVSLIDHGVPDDAIRETRLSDEIAQRKAHVLYPRDEHVLEARDLLPDEQGRRAVLVLLDGSWRQARRMSRRVPGIHELPFARLPEGDATSWSLRRPRHAHMLCTLEAASRAVALAGDESTARAMLDALGNVESRWLGLSSSPRRPLPARRSPDRP